MDSGLLDVEIRFESLHYTADELLRILAQKGFNDKETTRDIIKVVRQCLKTNFMQAFEELAPILNDFVNKKMIIVVHEFQSKENEDVLAYFNIYSTRNGSEGYFFGVYAPIILGYILDKTGIFDNEMVYSKGVWHHELIHMADYAKLTAFRQNFEKYHNHKPPIEYSWVYNQQDMHNNDHSRPWKMMSALSSFRDEGIPVLYEMLAKYKNPAIKDLNTAIAWFKIMFEPLQNILAFETVSNSQINAYHDTLKNIHTNSYQVGPWFVLNALYYSDNKEIELLAHRALNQNFDSLSHQEIITLLDYALNLDIGSFLYLDSKIEEGKAIQTFFDIDELVSFCSTFTSYGENYLVNNYLKTIMKYADNKDPIGFSKALLKIIGSSMDDEEIIEELANYSRLIECENCIENEVYQKTRIIYEQWLKSKNPTAQLVLTYILDPEDLLDDHVKYLGYIDDLYVLKAFEMLGG